jgi:hypothetical protein
MLYRFTSLDLARELATRARVPASRGPGSAQTNRRRADDGFFKSGSSSAGSLAGAGFFPVPMVGSRGASAVCQVRRSGKYRYADFCS